MIALAHFETQKKLRYFDVALAHFETQKNCDILMHGKKEKTTGCEAYLTYVSDLWFASAEVRRKIAQFFNV